MVHVYKKVGNEVVLRELGQLEAGNWVSVVAPTPEELDAVASRCRVSRELLEDSADPHELPRIEQEDGTTYAFLRIPVERVGKVDTRPLTIITTPNHLITVTLQDVPAVSHLVARGADVFAQPQPEFIISVFSDVLKSFYQHIKAIAKSVSRQRDRLRQPRNRDIVSLVVHEEALNDFNTSLLENIAIFERILSGKVIALTDPQREALQDLLVDANQVHNFCQENIDNITNIRKAYATILSNNLNQTLKFLTAVTVILSIPTMIASIFGMNIRLPYAADPNAFVYVMGGTIIASLATFIVFVWRKWM